MIAFLSVKDKVRPRMIIGTGRLYQTFEMSSDKTTKYPGVDGVTVPSLQSIRRACKFDNKSTVHVMVFVYVCGRRHQSVECKTRNGWGAAVLTVQSSNIISFMKPKQDPVINADDTHAVCDDPASSSSHRVPLTSSATSATLADNSAADEYIHVGTHPDSQDMHDAEPVAEHVHDQDLLPTPDTEIQESAISCNVDEVSGSTQLMGDDTDVAGVAPSGLLLNESADPVPVDDNVCPDVTASDNIPTPIHWTTSGVDTDDPCVGCTLCTTYSGFTHGMRSCHTECYSTHVLAVHVGVTV